MTKPSEKQKLDLISDMVVMDKMMETIRHLPLQERVHIFNRWMAETLKKHGRLRGKSAEMYERLKKRDQ